TEKQVDAIMSEDTDRGLPEIRGGGAEYNCDCEQTTFHFGDDGRLDDKSYKGGSREPRRTDFRARYDQVRKGMTSKQVDGIVKERPEIGRGGTGFYGEDCQKATFHFGDDGRLDDKSFQGRSWEPSWLEWVWQRLGY